MRSSEKGTPDLLPNTEVFEAYWTHDGPIFMPLVPARRVDVAQLWREFDQAVLDERLMAMRWLQAPQCDAAVRWSGQDHGSAAARRGHEQERRRRAKQARQGRRGRYYLSAPEIRALREQP